MMMGLIIKDLSNKLKKHIDDNAGVVFVDSSWANKWLQEYKAEVIVSIVDKEGKEIDGAKVAIKKKSST